MINLGYCDQFDGGVKFSAYIYNVGVLTGNLDLVFDNVVINNGNGYDSTSGVFRAPSDAIYSFQFSGQQSSTTDGSAIDILIMKNGATLFYIGDTSSNSDHYGYRNNLNWKKVMKSICDWISLTLYTQVLNTDCISVDS